MSNPVNAYLFYISRYQKGLRRALPLAEGASLALGAAIEMVRPDATLEIRTRGGEAYRLRLRSLTESEDRLAGVPSDGAYTVEHAVTLDAGSGTFFLPSGRYVIQADIRSGDRSWVARRILSVARGRSEIVVIVPNPEEGPGSLVIDASAIERAVAERLAGEEGFVARTAIEIAGGPNEWPWFEKPLVAYAAGLLYWVDEKGRVKLPALEPGAYGIRAHILVYWNPPEGATEEQFERGVSKMGELQKELRNNLVRILSVKVPAGAEVSLEVGR